MNKKAIYILSSILAVTTVSVGVLLYRNGTEFSKNLANLIKDNNTQEETSNSQNTQQSTDEQTTPTITPTTEASSTPTNTNNKPTQTPPTPTESQQTQTIHLPNKAFCYEPLIYEGKKEYPQLTYDSYYYQFRGPASQAGVGTYLIPERMLKNIQNEIIIYPPDEGPDKNCPDFNRFFMDAEIKELSSIHVNDGPVFLVTKLNDFGSIVEYIGTDNLVDNTTYDTFKITCTWASKSSVFYYPHSKDLSTGKYLLSGKVIPNEGGAAAGTTYIRIEPKSVIFCNNR